MPSILSHVKHVAAALLLSLHLTCANETHSDVDQIFQYFTPSPTPNTPANLGAYLWIPPQTATIRAVMVAVHNGLPISILHNPAIRAICRKHGIAQILLTPWASDIGNTMLKDLFYDITDPERTAIYDRYVARLAELSGHDELSFAPIIPLAHSAYCDFAFSAALRRPQQCLAALPIKAGLPDVYDLYAAGGKAKTPTPHLALRHVPILFVQSASQETVAWSPYPRGLVASGLDRYRRDHDNNDGSEYEPRNELFGMCWDMSSGHFDMLPRNYQFVANWLDAIASARLPTMPGEPLRHLTLRDGWLVNPTSLATESQPPGSPLVAAYRDVTKDRHRSLWYPTEKLARSLAELARSEPRKEIELFTFLDPAGAPISLAHQSLATLANAQQHLQGDGLLQLTTHHFITPPGICSNKDKQHAKNPDAPHDMKNLLFPGKSNLPTSKLPLNFDENYGVFQLLSKETFTDERGVTESRFTLRLKRHRLAPENRFSMSFVRVYHEGDDQFAAAGRTCQISIVPADAMPQARAQKIVFPTVPDAPIASQKIQLNATSSLGLAVNYFVLKGPGIIQGSAFVPMEIPMNVHRPIEVTIGAYQVGLFQEPDAAQPADTVYQTFRLTP